MISPSGDLRPRVIEAYLGHRLNHHELVDVVQKESGSAEQRETLDLYSERSVDWREKPAAAPQLSAAHRELGLAQRYSELREDQVWSREDRALHRRLSRLELDPPSAVSAERPVALDGRLLAAAEEVFTAWDRDGNLRLDRQELDYLMSGGAYGERLEEANDPEKAALMATVLRHQALLGSAVPSDGSGVSLADLGLWSRDDGLARSGAMETVNQTYHEYLEMAHGMGEPKALAEEAISGRHLRQGVIGSCVLLSTIAGTPDESLRQMFTDHGDGSVSVTFADGHTERVTEPSLAARLFHTQGREGERWPALLETAAAQRLLEDGHGAANGLRGVIDGIDPAFAIRVLTDRPLEQHSLDEISLIDTRRLLEGRPPGPVLCGSRPTASSDFINVEELHNGIINGHCYAIHGYDPETDRVELQNPWHKGEWKFEQDGTDDGFFSMPLRDFYSSFRWVAWPGQPA